MFPFMRRAEETPVQERRRPPVLGLVLGAGAARGWAHIGVLHELAASGLSPQIVVGCSIGAVVGGSYAAGKLIELENFARSLTKRRVFGLMDLNFAGRSLVGGRRLQHRLEEAFGEMRIEDLPLAFAAVATEVGTGHEIWLRKGLLAPAIRASYALPGIFEPVRIGNRWLFDGALVNPVPITTCRALGADMVIAVNVNSDTVGRGTVIQDHATMTRETPDSGSFLSEIADKASILRRQFSSGPDNAPGLAAVVVDAFNITQDRITRSRLAGDPPDVMIGARLGRMGLFDFHRADEMIAVGREATRRAVPDIKEQMALLSEQR